MEGRVEEPGQRESPMMVGCGEVFGSFRRAASSCVRYDAKAVSYAVKAL